MTMSMWPYVSVTECIKQDFFKKEETYMPLWLIYVSYDYASLIVYKAGRFKNEETRLYDLYL
jgi:hypothetical protein